MHKKQTIDELSNTELAQFLHRRKRQQRRQRLQRLKENGRTVNVVGLPPPDAALSFGLAQTEELGSPEPKPVAEPLPQSKSRWIMNKVLLLVEIAAVIGFIFIGVSFWNTNNELNQELAQIQRAQSEALAFPSPAATPIIDVVVLPGGHKPPIPGQSPEQGEAGDIPANLLPAINAYIPPPAPTPSAVLARRIQIPGINVDAPVVQGMYDWEQLKRGVAQKIDSAAPGEVGNMALAAHNDIYGEIFRDLDQLSPGDEIIVSNGVQSFTYIVRETRIVEPTEVSVLEPTDFASTTLISCYPYRVNTQRIVVFADLANS